MRRKKEPECLLVAHRSLKVTHEDFSYFDNGYSRHMNMNQNFLIYFEDYPGSRVTFSNGKKWNIHGKGTLNVFSLARLKNEFLVQGLKANFISIIHLCDQGMLVNSTKDRCEVSSKTK